ncbi:MAG TPA: GldM family protein [Bacteroidia bacterium]|nr:GldM family protein [Bacteroidia bacterium]
MSSGKETPRQKMIGMMYLVLTALLALNVSKEILQGFVMVDESIGKSKVILDENNSRIQKAFEDYVKDGNFEAKPYLLKSIETQKSIRVVDAYIDSMKVIIARKTEGISKSDTSQLRFMEKLDDYDTPTYLLIGSDESKPIDTKYSAKDLRLQLTNLHQDLLSLIDNMQKNSKTKLDDETIATLKQKLSTIKPIDRNIEKDGIKLNWELENFYHMPLAAVITNLDKIQADMKNLESEFLHTFAAASSKYVFKANILHADVVAPSAYVLSGQPFKANIVLGASSTDFTPDKMEILVGGVYDTTSKKLTNPGTPVPIKNGMGQYEAMTNATGEKELKGVIKYKNSRGELEYYPFDYSYMVAPPFSAVAADNMNIFYAGIDNPVSATCAGFSPADLKLSINGCGAEAKLTSAGKYIVTAKNSGTCSVIVSAKVNGTYQQQGPVKVFRVKDIPPPVLKMGGKVATTNLEFSRAELRQIGGFGAESVGFMFPANFVVKSFEVLVQGGGTFTCSNNNLTQEAKTALNNMRTGQIAYIDNIKVLTPKQTVITIPSVKFKIKS